MDELEKQVREKLTRVAHNPDDRKVKEEVVSWLLGVFGEYYGSGYAEGSNVALERIQEAFLEGLSRGANISFKGGE